MNREIIQVEKIYPFSLTQSGLMDTPLIICDPYHNNQTIEEIDIVNVLMIFNPFLKLKQWHILCSREYKRNPKNILSQFEYIPKGYQSYEHAKKSSYKILAECPYQYAFNAESIEDGLVSIPILKLAGYYDVENIHTKFYKNPLLKEDLERHELILSGNISKEIFELN